ncbi:hypothetical protein SAY86_019942 [Trapa natans]|uniref:Uncharacterized protein n=1 Tax=Trapa natans TaxID=22666 RepID=A0AAN7LI68_TRANT|nr:hypothetical protein SAY86_019942 [Trapa natans]
MDAGTIWGTFVRQEPANAILHPGGPWPTLHYHTRRAQGIIHRILNTTSIFLDDNFVAKVSDFEMSKDAPIGARRRGVSGTWIPSTFGDSNRRTSRMVDSGGGLAGGPVCEASALPREQVNLVVKEWAMEWKRKGSLEKVIDPRLLGTIKPESMKKFAVAAEKCLGHHGVDRPTTFCRSMESESRGGKQVSHHRQRGWQWAHTRFLPRPALVGR